MNALSNCGEDASRHPNPELAALGQVHRPKSSPTPVQVNNSLVATHTVKMAKSKNASQHHANRKNLRNGIKKPKTHRYPSLKGVDPKFRRNHRHALHGTAKALRERKEGKREVA
ncbi:60S ribosomal protein L29 [Monascus purpureus]|uniref:60S ribosomal protein L29 n=1 Tax=Monascus purpureus TaxID=5098 RepID=A0A507R0L6_MONPU|nr:60S ribosomal protein L29 [Monascus purpureus]